MSDTYDPFNRRGRGDPQRHAGRGLYAYNANRQPTATTYPNGSIARYTGLVSVWLLCQRLHSGFHQPDNRRASRIFREVNGTALIALRKIGGKKELNGHYTFSTDEKMIEPDCGSLSLPPSLSPYALCDATIASICEFRGNGHGVDTTYDYSLRILRDSSFANQPPSTYAFLHRVPAFVFSFIHIRCRDGSCRAGTPDPARLAQRFPQAGEAAPEVGRLFRAPGPRRWEAIGSFVDAGIHPGANGS